MHMASILRRRIRIREPIGYIFFYPDPDIGEGGDILTRVRITNTYRASHQHIKIFNPNRFGVKILMSLLWPTY